MANATTGDTEGASRANADPAPKPKSLTDILSEAREAAREQLAAAWQIEMDRLQEQLANAWRGQVDHVIEQRFEELEARIREQTRTQMEQTRTQMESAAA